MIWFTLRKFNLKMTSFMQLLNVNWKRISEILLTRLGFQLDELILPLKTITLVLFVIPMGKISALST